MSEIFEGLMFCLNGGKCVSGIFLDIRKPFDSVDHTVLLSKLFECIVCGMAYKWFESYYNGKKPVFYCEIGIKLHENNMVCHTSMISSWCNFIYYNILMICLVMLDFSGK